MKITLCICLALASYFGSYSALAGEKSRNWHWVTASLRAKGINPNMIQWSAINHRCMWANPGTDAFAGCQYEQVMNQTQHSIDREQCESESIAAYPKSATQQRLVYHSGFSWIEDRYRRSELRTAREAYISRCMAEFGWRSPHNPQLGHRNEQFALQTPE